MSRAIGGGAKRRQGTKWFVGLGGNDGCGLLGEGMERRTE